ncbi:MAG: molybdopterin-dependent oxidoreductase [Propionibacteriaceae bacterium]|nr:molybdopterin-dependent oxidoreductase [Propionibacteriaceae bacterium]
MSGRGADRVTTPLVRRDGELVEASWPEALDAAVAGLKAAGASTGVLTGGRLTREVAAQYAALARDTLGTEDIDCRARAISAEETEFLWRLAQTRPRPSAPGAAGAGPLGSDDPGPAPVTYSASGAGAGQSGSDDPGPGPVTYSDLEAAGHVVLVGFEPEDEAPIVFLRLRKANRRNKVKVTVIAPYLSVGSAKLNATLVATAPGAEAAALAALDLDEGTVVLGGERLATSPGALQALAQTSQKGARWAWIPRRPGEIGALQAGAFPRPTGRAADAIVAALNSGDLKAVVIGGVELQDLPDPKAAQAALRKAFTVSLEQRLSDAAELADVVLPVNLLEETSGTFVNWEWRDCPVAQVITRPASPMTEIRVLQALAEALAQAPGGPAVAGPGSGIGARDSAPSAGPLAEAADDPAASAGPILATHRELLDDARLTDNETALIASARPVVARVNGRTAQTFGLGDAARVTLNGVAFDLVVDDTVVDGVVWAPARARGHDLAAAGLVVGRPVALAKEAAA